LSPVFFETQVQAVGAGFDFLGKTQLVQLQMYLQIKPRLPRFTGAIATDAGRELAKDAGIEQRNKKVAGI